MMMRKQDSPERSIGSICSPFLTWSASPVRELSSTFRSLLWIITPSAGSRSPKTVKMISVMIKFWLTKVLEWRYSLLCLKGEQKCEFQNKDKGFRSNTISKIKICNFPTGNTKKADFEIERGRENVTMFQERYNANICKKRHKHLWIPKPKRGQAQATRVVDFGQLKIDGLLEWREGDCANHCQLEKVER